LLALQSQLNPHFLFNTMETIYWKTLALTGKPNEATAMIEQLSDILHYALNSDERLVSLQEEIEITKAYLHIQHVRYKDAFTVIWDVPPSLDHISVLRLLLQPLVENSIYHGIRGLDRPAQITIKVTEKESHVRIAIIDDGRGMDQVHLEAVRKSLRGSSIDRSTHIGLMNTNKRLQLQYGKTCKLHLYSKPNRGTCIIIKIPNPGLNTEIS
jgi:two-component system sensor histidine kinase YesM